MAGLPGLGTEDRWIDPPGRGDVVAGLLGPFRSVRRGQAEPVPDEGVAEGDLEQPPSLRRRRRLVRRAGHRVGTGQRLGVERGPPLRAQRLQERPDSGLGLRCARRVSVPAVSRTAAPRPGAKSWRAAVAYCRTPPKVATRCLVLGASR